MASILLSVSADGNITYWHAMSGKSIISMKETADLYCADFSRDGQLLAVGGKEYEVKVYDDSTKSLAATLRANGSSSQGHSNRIFALKFSDDPNLLISGGWDNVVFFWDLRQAKSVGFVYGPHICGDSIDVRGDTVLTGSYSNKDVLQLWSIKERKLIDTIRWESGDSAGYDHGYLYAAMFDRLSAQSKYIAAGGAGQNELRIFRSAKEHEMVGKVCFGRTVTSVDFASGRGLIAAACGDGSTHIYSIQENVLGKSA